MRESEYKELLTETIL